jgi:hypothetical protein
MSIATRLISAGIVETLADITSERQDCPLEAILLLTTLVSAGMVPALADGASETRIKKLEQRNLTIALDAGTIKHK